MTDLHQVYSGTMHTLPPDILSEGRYSVRRQRKMMRRLAKKVWGQKIIEYTGKLAHSHTTPSQTSKSGLMTHGDEMPLPKYPLPDISMVGPGEDAPTLSNPETKYSTPDEVSASQLESVGLSPEPEARSPVSAELISEAQNSQGSSQERNRTKGSTLSLEVSEESSKRSDKTPISSPSNELLLKHSNNKQNVSTLHSSPFYNYSSRSKNVHAGDATKSTAREALGLWGHDKTVPNPGVSTHRSSTVAGEYFHSSAPTSLRNRKDVGPFTEGLVTGHTNSVNHDKVKLETVGLRESSEMVEDATATSETRPAITNLETLEDPLDAQRNMKACKGNGVATGRLKYRGQGSLYQRSNPRKGLRRESNAILAVNNEEVLPSRKVSSFLEPSHQVTHSGDSPLRVFKGQDRSNSDPNLERTLAVLCSSSTTLGRPYKPRKKFDADNHSSPEAIKHVDFTDTECEILLHIVCGLRESRTDLSTSTEDQLKIEMSRLGSDDIEEVVRQAHAKERLPQRERKSIRKFLRSLKKDDVREVRIPSFVQVESSRTDPVPEIAISTLLRRRAYGSNDGYSSQRDLRYAFTDNITPQRSWKGASGDIVSTAWHPNSQTYAVGATATSNPEDLQYNRPNNLLYGDVNQNTLHELPDHRIDRPKPGTISNGPNSSQAVYEACDPKVYKTVPAIQFSPQGAHLFTASHDSTVKIWDLTSNKLPSCVKTLYHEANVDNLEVSLRLPNTFATGTHTTGNSIRVYSQASIQCPYECVSLSSSRAQAKPQHGIFPECLRWGVTPMTEHLLLAGFARWGELPDNDPGREGELCIWDINTGQKIRKMPSSQSVFTAAFHPFLDVFATGGSPGNGALTHQYTTRTVVRMWDMRIATAHWKIELECPALDMQDITFHPRDANLVAVGCTDGAVYVWDIRNADYVLHKLHHGDPIADWDNRYGGSSMSREQGDAGVTMTLWGPAKSHHLFTGATDGIVKRWDVNRAPEDALIKEIVQLPAGVSCGSFSPDSMSLLVGDSTGGVHLLSSDPGFPSEDEAPSHDRISVPRPFQFVPAPRNDPPLREESGQGRLASLELIRSGQLVVDRDFGVGQGPNYAGPYATYAHKDGPPNTTELTGVFEEAQPVSRDGHVRDNVAARTITATIARRREVLNRDRETTEPLFRGITGVRNAVDLKTSPSKKRKYSESPDDCSVVACHKKLKATTIVDLTSDAEDEVSIVNDEGPQAFNTQDNNIILKHAGEISSAPKMLTHLSGAGLLRLGNRIAGGPVNGFSLLSVNASRSRGRTKACKVCHQSKVSWLPLNFP